MTALADMIKPKIGLFCSLTDEHGENFESLEQKANQKALLFKDATLVLYPERNEIIYRALKLVNPNLMLVPVDDDNRAMARLLAQYAEANAPLSHSFDPDTRLDVISTRIDVLQALKDCLIIYDGFTHDLRSVADALNFMQKRSTPGRTSTVIMAPLPDDDADYATLAELLYIKGANRLIMVGNIPDEAAATLRSKVEKLEMASDYLDFMRHCSISDFASELILIKGTAADGFASITSHLEAPRHETVLEVNLNALVHNYNFFKSQLPATSSLITMVKADGYGVGALEVSKTMQSQGAAMLAVAVVDEGVALRQAGITMPIIVMNPMGTNYKALFDFRLEPSVFSMRELDTLLRYAEIYDVHDYPIHLKLDTGMHRLGFLEEELPDLAAALKNQNRLTPASVFSHLATADCLDKDEATESQVSRFTRVLPNFPPSWAIRSSVTCSTLPVFFAILTSPLIWPALESVSMACRPCRPRCLYRCRTWLLSSLPSSLYATGRQAHISVTAVRACLPTMPLWLLFQLVMPTVSLAVLAMATLPFASTASTAPPLAISAWISAWSTLPRPTLPLAIRWWCSTLKPISNAWLIPLALSTTRCLPPFRLA